MGILVLILRVLAVVLVLVSSKWNPPTIHLGFLGIGIWMIADLLSGVHA